MNAPITPAKLEEIKYNEFTIRKFSHEDGFEAYYIDDIGKVLSLVSARKLINSFSRDEIVSSELKNKYSIITYQRYKDNHRRNKKVILVNKIGLIRMINMTRSTKANDLAKFFNINVYEHRFAPVEASTIKIIQDSFAGENMITQYQVNYQVNNYRIDLYFPDYKIAVECDEHNHSDRNSEYETNRENTLKSELNCKFVRYNPNAIDFSIGKVINQIYKIIINVSK